MQKVQLKKSTAFRYGLVAGYKQFFTPAFGARYYAMVDLGTDYKKENSKQLLLVLNFTSTLDSCDKRKKTNFTN